MKILIGTTNYSKRQRFQALLSDIDTQFITLDDCDIEQEPEELWENAGRKRQNQGCFLWEIS